MPGSIVRTLPARSVSPDSVERRGASWTSSPTPCPSPWPKFSPKPAAVDRSRASSSASTPVMPRLDVRARALLRLEADVVGLAQPVGQPAGGERARAIAAVAVDAHAPVDRDERAAIDDPVRGCACGWAPFGPEATMLSNESSSAPCACSSSRSRHAISRSLRPTQRLRGQGLEAAVGDAARRCSLATSSSSLIARSSSTTPLDGTSSPAPSASACHCA